MERAFLRPETMVFQCSDPDDSRGDFFDARVLWCIPVTSLPNNSILSLGSGDTSGCERPRKLAKDHQRSVFRPNGHWDFSI